MIDYRELLKKYMSTVLTIEDVTFIEYLSKNYNDEGYSHYYYSKPEYNEEEFEAIKKIEKEVKTDNGYD